MLAVHTMSEGTQAILFFIAFVAFVVAGVLAWLAKNIWGMLVAAGLALWVFILFWNALAVS